jgi:N-acetylgalactosamine kinase
MGRPDLPKVLFPIAGVPAVVRTLQTLSRCGVQRHIVVVGNPAGILVDTISADCPNTAFVVQSPPRGTGDAARIGSELLEDLSATGSVLVCAGDKYIEPSLVRRLLDAGKHSDFALVTTPRQMLGPKSEGGLVLSDSQGIPACIVEMPDYLARCAAPMWMDVLRRGADPDEVQKKTSEFGRDSAKFRKMLDTWHQLAAENRLDELHRALEPYAQPLRLGGEILHTAEIDLFGVSVNASVYLIKADILFRLVQKINSDNAQGEYYLTDLLRLCRRHYPESNVLQVVQKSPGEVMAFNNPQELLEIERHVQGRAEEIRAIRTQAERRWSCPLEQWERALTSPCRTALAPAFSEIYGESAGRSKQTALLQKFREDYGGEGDVMIVRSPARINLMGRHIDHQGGPINVMAIDREVWMVARPREDDLFRLTNMDPARFPDRSFRLNELIAQLSWESWLDTIHSPRTSEMVARLQGDWGHYARAAALRLQSRFRDRSLRGADIVVGGDIPTGAGLSSSSAMVVAFAELIIGMNGLEVESRELVDYCGQGEWFVGTRGGAADHAAIKMSMRGQVSHFRFFPFDKVSSADFFAGHSILVVHSGVEAPKSAAARDAFNQKVACYHMGLAILRLLRPAWRDRLQYLRDFDPSVLGDSWGDMISVLRRLPNLLSVSDWRRTWAPMLDPETRDALATVMAAHQPPEAGYSVRSIVLFGIAEMQRARLAMQLLEAGDPAGFGHLMNRSHDGDRVSHPITGKRFIPRVDWDQLEERLADPERYDGREFIAEIPGGYGCSIEKVDRIVDHALNLRGVRGAQIAGAGLGGCCMVLVEQSCQEQVRAELQKLVSAPVQVCSSVGGACLLPPP